MQPSRANPSRHPKRCRKECFHWRAPVDGPSVAIVVPGARVLLSATACAQPCIDLGLATWCALAVLQKSVVACSRDDCMRGMCACTCLAQASTSGCTRCTKSGTRPCKHMHARCFLCLPHLAACQTDRKQACIYALSVNCANSHSPALACSACQVHRQHVWRRSGKKSYFQTDDRTSETYFNAM